MTIGDDVMTIDGPLRTIMMTMMTIKKTRIPRHCSRKCNDDDR